MLFKVYKVGQVYEAGTWNELELIRNLKNKIKEKDIPIYFGEKGNENKFRRGSSNRYFIS